MIAKIIKGADFHRLARYLTKDGRGETIDMRHLSSDDPEAAAQEMQVAASVSVRTKSPVMHIVVSYDPNDAEPSNADMARDAAEVLHGLGLGKNQAMVIRHRDRAHPHMHLMVNRVAPHGKAVSDSQSYPKTEAVLRRIERRRGLTITPGRNAPDPDAGRRMRGDRTTPDPRQHGAPPGVKKALAEAQTWDELHAGLKRHGWRAEIVKRGKGSGLVLVGPDGQRVGAGQVDRGATLSRLRTRFGSKTTENPNVSGHSSHTPAPVSARAAGAALAKPFGRTKRRKGGADDRAKAVMQTGTQIVGSLVSIAAHQPLIGRRRIGSALTSNRKRHPGRGPGLGL